MTLWRVLQFALMMSAHRACTLPNLLGYDSRVTEVYWDVQDPFIKPESVKMNNYILPTTSPGDGAYWYDWDHKKLAIDFDGKTYTEDKKVYPK